jgi:hypothetical protein
VFQKRDPRIPRIYSLELQEVYAGRETPDGAKQREYQRLRDLQRNRGFSLYFVQKSFKKLFGEMPTITDASLDERREEYQRLKSVAESRGFKPGFAKVRYKEMFGSWPGREVDG